MKVFFRKLFGIYPGEGKKTIRFALLVITWSLGSACISTLTDGLFVEKLGGSNLPGVYMMAAVSMIIGSSLILWLLKTFSPYKILMGVLSVGSVVVALVAPMVYYTPPLWLWFAIKVFSLTLSANLIACSWALIDNYHDLQDAKRTYSMYNASYFLGVVISGVLISTFLEKVGLSALFIISAICLLAALFLIKKIVTLDQPIHDETIEGVFTGDRKGVFYLIKQIFSHPFVFSLLSLSLIIQLIGTTTEYCYLSSIGKFLGDADGKEVTKYLGNTRAIISMFNIIIGVFFYNRFVKVIGLRNIILLPAFAFFILFGKWLHSDSLIIAIFGLISLDGISYTIEDNNYNQLINAVPSKLKTKVRIINDSFFEPLGMLISSSLLLYTNSRLLGFMLAIIMIVFSFVIRAIYRKYIFINLKENAVHFDKKPLQWLFAKTKDERQRNIKDLIKGLHNNVNEINLLSIEGLLALCDEAYLEKIIKKADTFQTNEKLAFLHLIEKSIFSNHILVIKTLIRWKDHTSDKKLFRKCLILLARKENYYPNFNQTDLDGLDVFKKSIAILTILNHTPKESQKLYILKKKARYELIKQLNSLNAGEQILALEILGNIKSSFSFKQALVVLSRFDQPETLKQASAVVAKFANSSHSKFIPDLLKILKENKNSQIRLNCLSAIGKIRDISSIFKIVELSLYFRPSERRCIEQILVSIGPSALPNLLSILKDTTLHDKSRILAAKIIAEIDLKTLRKCFKSIVLVEIERSYFYLYNTRSIQQNYPNKDLLMVVEVLKTAFHSSIDFIIHLLAAVGSVEDCELLVRSLRSKNAKIHSHAIETLENACERKIFKLIAPLVDNLPWSVFIDSYTSLTGKTPKVQLSAVLEQLNRSPSISDKLIVASFNEITRLNNVTTFENEQKLAPTMANTRYLYEVAET